MDGWDKVDCEGKLLCDTVFHTSLWFVMKKWPMTWENVMDLYVFIIFSPNPSVALWHGDKIANKNCDDRCFFILLYVNNTPWMSLLTLFHFYTLEPEMAAIWLTAHLSRQEPLHPTRSLCSAVSLTSLVYLQLLNWLMSEFDSNFWKHKERDATQQTLWVNPVLLTVYVTQTCSGG